MSSVVMGALSPWLLSLSGLGGLRGWQWLFLVEGFPAVLIGIGILRFLPDAPASAGWLSDAERNWLTTELSHEAAQIGHSPHTNVLSSLRNPLIFWFTLLYLLPVSAWVIFSLSAPILLKMATGMSTGAIGYLVSLGGILGVLSILATGWFSDHRGDSFRPLLAALIVEALALVVIATKPSPLAVVFAYLLGSAAYTAAMQAQVTLWTDVFPVRVLGICGAAINTVLQMGNFLGPFAFGVARDATGSYTAGLLALTASCLLALALCVMLRRKLNATSARAMAT